MANSARNWSLSAWISAIDSGVAASSRRVVSRTARLCTSGTIINPHSIEIKKPIARYMIGSIMNATPNDQYVFITLPWAADKTPVHCRNNVNPSPVNARRRNVRDQNGFQVARGVYLR